MLLSLKLGNNCIFKTERRASQQSLNKTLYSEKKILDAPDTEYIELQMGINTLELSIWDKNPHIKEIWSFSVPSNTA